MHHVFSQIVMHEWEDNNTNGRIPRCVCAADSAEFNNGPPAKCISVAPLNCESVKISLLTYHLHMRRLCIMLLQCYERYNIMLATLRCFSNTTVTRTVTQCSLWSCLFLTLHGSSPTDFTFFLGGFLFV